MGKRGNMIFFSRLAIFMGMLLGHWSLHAQYFNPKFENLDTVDGLSSSTCLSIFQDSEGFLWFGTIDGLNKYNGYEFEIYRSSLNDPTSISNNRINAIVEDSHGNLWIGTDNGLNFFNKNTDSFLRIDLFEDASRTNNPRKFINDLFYDAEGDVLWVATNDGAVTVFLAEFEGNAQDLMFNEYRHEPTDPHSLDNNNVNVILSDHDGLIWIGTDGQHLNRYDPVGDNFEWVTIKSDTDYELNHIPKRVFVDAENDFWIGNDLSNLIFWDRKEDSFKHLSFTEAHIPLRDLLDRDGLLWASTDGHGLFLLKKETVEIEHNLVYSYSDPFSLPNNNPSEIYEDRHGIFWIGSYDKGVSKLDFSQSAFGHHYYRYGDDDGLNGKTVQSVLQDSQGRIWISAYNGGINLYNEKRNTFEHFAHNPHDRNSLSSNKILYTFESRDGKIWVCTLDGGLNSFDPQTHRVERYLHNSADLFSIGQNSVWAGTEDPTGRLWLGLRTEGLCLYNRTTRKFHTYKSNIDREKGLASNFVFFLFVDSKNRLLIGTSLGLNYLELDQINDPIPGQLEFSEVQISGIEDYLVNHITEDHLGNIWVGTDTGVYKLDSDLNLIKSYSSQNGLPNDLVVGIQEDNSHNFWITTKSGLSLLDPKTHRIKNFNLHDGLQGPEFQSKSITKTDDGRILIGGINGFNLFHPNDISKNLSRNLQPKITALRINNSEVRVGDTINRRVLLDEPLAIMPKLELRYYENYVSFDFVALHFDNPERVQYAYMLDGLEKEIVNVGRRRNVNYSNLRPGDYVFEVKASLDGDWETAQSAQIMIQILPPPWKTWWAYTLFTLFGLVLFWLAMRYYTQRVRDSQQRELDQLKLRFFANVSHELKTPLTLILNPVEKILAKFTTDPAVVKSSALTIQRSSRRLLHLVNQLLDYRKMDAGMAPLQREKGNIVKFCEDIFTLFEGLAAKKSIEYRFEADTGKIVTLFDFDKVEKIVTNLLSNAIKFTDPGGSIIVSVDNVAVESKKRALWKKTDDRTEYVKIQVTDTGIGLNELQLKSIFERFYHPYSTKSGTGIGLNFTKALVEMHGGTIEVESEHKKGSTFTVYLPIDLRSQPAHVEDVKNQYLFNSVKAVEYDLAMHGNESDTKQINTPTPTERSSILIVEDNRELRMHLLQDLQKDYNVREAATGIKGLDMAKKWSPDLIISDVMMPKMDGFEMCRRLKEDFDTCHIPVLLLTAKTHDTDRIDGYESGADGYLAKPFVTSVLKARIANLLEAKRRLRERFSEIGGLLPSKEVTTNNLDATFLDKATKVIIDNIEDIEFKQEDLLRELGMGRSQLYRKINSLTGNNPSHFIRTIRLRYASGLLVKQEYSIKEIAYMSGFGSTAYFSKTFRELFNMTPTEYIDQKGKVAVDK